AGAFVERVEEADIAVAAQAEDVRHLFAHEIVDDHLTAVEHVFGHRLTSSLLWRLLGWGGLAALCIARLRRLGVVTGGGGTQRFCEVFGWPCCGLSGVCL